jgi:hypothetical protein
VCHADTLVKLIRLRIPAQGRAGTRPISREAGSPPRKRRRVGEAKSAATASESSSESKSETKSESKAEPRPNEGRGTTPSSGTGVPPIHLKRRPVDEALPHGRAVGPVPLGITISMVFLVTTLDQTPLPVP